MENVNLHYLFSCDFKAVAYKNNLETRIYMYVVVATFIVFIFKNILWTCDWVSVLYLKIVFNIIIDIKNIIIKKG